MSSSPRLIIAGVLLLVVDALAAGPLLRYSFDEDTSGYRDPVDIGSDPPALATLEGINSRWTNTPGSFSCAAFDIRGGRGYLTTTGDVDKVDALPAMTITLWLNMLSTPAVDDRLVSDLPPSLPAPPAGTGGWELWITEPSSGSLSASNFGLSFGMLQSSGSVSYMQFSQSPDIDANNKWVFIAVTFGTDGYQEYYIGTETSPVSQVGIITIFSFTLTDNDSELRIAGTAAEPTTDRSPPSFIDDVRIYDSALTLAELDNVRRDNLEILAVGQVPSFHGIGSLRRGFCESWANAVSADGSTIVGQGDINGNSAAIIWKDGTMTSLPNLAGHSSSIAEAVSADGSVVAGHSSKYPDDQAVRWNNNIAEPLGYLPGGAKKSYSQAISGDGSVVVGYAHAAANPLLRAFKWVPNSLQQLPALGSQVEAIAFDVSLDGSTIVGVAANDQLTGEACRWENGVPTGLGDLPGGPFQSFAYAISADKSTIVGFGLTDTRQEACLWRNGPPQPLGVLPGSSSPYSGALAVSGNGLVVVGYSRTAVGLEAFIWDPLNGMRNLKEVLVNEYRLDLAGWALSQATGISEDGTVIVGKGENPVGNSEGWIVRLPALAINHSADLDGDGDVDADDLSLFVACATGPDVPYDVLNLPAECMSLVGPDGMLPLDFDRDRDVDQTDFGSRMQRCFSGTNIPAASECLE